MHEYRHAKLFSLGPEWIKPCRGGYFTLYMTADGLTAEHGIELLREMLRIRRFEETCAARYSAGAIRGFLHLYIGEEAVAVGAVRPLSPADAIVSTYREHGHALARGLSMESLMGELFGKANGCSRGRGGSMHFFAPDKNYWGGHGIVGGQIPLGVGLAYGVKYKGLKGAAMAFMGDGAVNQGAVHEAYNLASLWNLPVVFVIENNGYSMGTSQARSSALSWATGPTGSSSRTAIFASSGA